MKKRIMKSIAAFSVMLAVSVGMTTAAFANPTNAEKKPARKKAAAHPKTVKVTVNKDGFNPSSISAEEGSPLTLVFTRTSKEGCGTKVVFPSLNISRNLPVGKAVTVKITPDKSGEIAFTCGMGMMKGTIVAH